MSGLFESDSYLKIVGPSSIVFELGLSLYFASQGTHAVFWSVFASVGRLAIAAGIETYVTTTLSGNHETLLYFVATSLVVYGAIPVLSLTFGAWWRAYR